MKMDYKGININTLGEKCGISPNTLYNLRSLDKVPKIHGAVEKIATYLGTTPEYLLTGKNDEESLSPDEKKLILFFQSLNDEKKKLALNLIETMAIN